MAIYGDKSFTFFSLLFMFYFLKIYATFNDSLNLIFDIVTAFVK